MKKFFSGLFMMIAFLALSMVGGEPMGDTRQIWTSFILLGVFAGSFYMVDRLST